MKTLIFIFIVLTSGMTNCQKKTDNSNVKKSNLDLVRLNDYAAELSTMNQDNKDSLQKALGIINQVLEKDSSSSTAENNKFRILLFLRDRENALNMVNKFILKDKKFVNNYLIKGHILEKLNRRDDANKEYAIASNICEENLNNNSNDTNAKVILVQIHLLTKPIETVKIEYSKLQKEFPNNKTVILMDQLVNSFDREKYLEMY